MKKMSRKNFRGGPLFSGKANGAASNGVSSSSPNMLGTTSGTGTIRRSTWANKIRDKLPPLGENEYEVLWERGVLGVIFLESEKDGIPYVSKATESCISPAVNQGDILKYVNVVCSKDHSFSDFFKILATMKKPVLLRFERLSASTPSSDEDETSHLFGTHQSSSTPVVSKTSQSARQNATYLEEEHPTKKYHRSNSDQIPIAATQKPIWHPDKPVGLTNLVPSVGLLNKVNGENDDKTESNSQRRTKDQQVSPRDAITAEKSGDKSSSSPLGPKEYQVYWETGPLGLYFGEEQSTNLPVVTRTTASANPVVRRAVTVNDTLVSANGIKSADYMFETFFGRLQQMSKPVRLVFRRRDPSEQVVIVKQGDQQQQKQQRQQQVREQEQKRELQNLREHEQRDQQQRVQEQRNQHQRGVHDLVRKQSTVSQNRTPSPSPAELSWDDKTPFRTQTSSPTVKRVSTPPPQSPSSQNPGVKRHDKRSGDSELMEILSSTSSSKNLSSTEFQASPKTIMLPPGDTKIDKSSGAAGRNDKSGLRSPISPPIAIDVTNEGSKSASSVLEQTEGNSSTTSTIDDNYNQAPKMNFHSSEKSQAGGNREDKQPQNSIDVAAQEERTVSSNPNRELWDLAEKSPSRKVTATSSGVELNNIVVGVPVSPSVAVITVKQGEMAELTQKIDNVEVAIDAELVSEDIQGDEKPGSRLHSLNAAENISDIDVDFRANMEMGISENEIAKVNGNGWDLDPESDHHLGDAKTRTSSGKPSILNDVESSKIDFTSESDPSDEFASDLDMPNDIDVVESNIMIHGASKDKEISTNTVKPSKSSLHANLAKYKKKGKTARGLTKMPVLTEAEALTVPLVAPNAVNTSIQVRGRPKPKQTMADTPDSTTYLIKWKENRSIGLQLKEVHFAAGTYPLVTDVCQEPCCESLRHICVGDVIIEINGRNTSTMGVKKTINFLKTCTKTTLMKIRHGPAFVIQRVSAAV